MRASGKVAKTDAGCLPRSEREKVEREKESEREREGERDERLETEIPSQKVRRES